MFEMMVSATVFAILAISLLSYVQFGAEAWKRGHQKLNVTSYFRAVTETIQRDLQLADRVKAPAVGVVTTMLEYDLPIFQAGAYQGTGTVRLTHSPTARTISRSLQSVSSGLVSTFANRFSFTVARDVATFTVSRLSSYTVKVALGIESLAFGEDDLTGTKLATLTFMIPSGR